MKPIMKKAFPPMIAILTAFAIAAAFVVSLNVTAEGTMLVSGNTSVAENQEGWMFNRDTTSLYTFIHDKASLGIGSLYVGPIGASAEMFTAEYFPQSLPVSSFHSFSYDFLMGAGAEETDLQFFQARIFANIDDSNNYFDCRYDYVAKAGSKEFFTKSVLFAQDAPLNVVTADPARTTCPPTLEMMPVGSHIRAIALSVGDETDADSGLDAYFDNVEVALKSDFTVFNFEPRPRTKEDCQGDKWKLYRFKNQGQCMKSF